MKRLKSMLGPQPSREDLEREAAEDLEAASRAPGGGEVAPPPVAPQEALLEPEADQDTGEPAPAETEAETEPAEEEAPAPPLRARRTRKKPPADAAARRSAGGKVRVGGRQP